MRRLVYYIASSVDGFIADSEGKTDAFAQSPEYLAELADRFPDTFPAHVRTPLGIGGPNRQFDTVLMGRHTYEPALQSGITSPYPHLEQYVFSRRLAPTAEQNLHIVADDPVATVRGLKARPGPLDLWLCGGGHLAAQLLPELDELIVKLNPVVLGSGIPLFSGVASVPLTLVEQQALHGGVALLRYLRAQH
ncbi:MULTISPECIES: dihydrofolate reductase family protein [Deinococcus]|uniref:Dihydrofolate reductase family protein n=1 Tax=Deinococcus rufus TaxID=2136097 RepID=A0ABV7ZGR1_9DEIO|nr:dihydrofolate reductase family protein [Deinococcus sp. AB2017081]WQE93591.1 dihydrofolate reductase family protein [Deinococcus sp. AB2017081]